MIVVNRETGSRTGGPLDILCILHNVSERHFRIVFFDSGLWSKSDALMAEQLDVIDVKMKFLHPERAKTLAQAREYLAEMREWVALPDRNVAQEPIPWDGQFGTRWNLKNWWRDAITLDQAIAEIIDQKIGEVVS